MVANGQFGIIVEPQIGKYKKIAKWPRWASTLYAFAYISAMFAASPAPSMEAAFGRLHKGGTPLVDSIEGAGEAANMAKI